MFAATDKPHQGYFASLPQSSAEPAFVLEQRG